MILFILNKRCDYVNPSDLKSITDDLVITCDEVIKGLNTGSTSLNDKTSDILLSFLLVTILLLISVTIYYSFIKQRSQQKEILPY